MSRIGAFDTWVSNAHQGRTRVREALETSCVPEGDIGDAYTFQANYVGLLLVSLQVSTGPEVKRRRTYDIAPVCLSTIQIPSAEHTVLGYLCRRRFGNIVCDFVSLVSWRNKHGSIKTHSCPYYSSLPCISWCSHWVPKYRLSRCRTVA